MPPAERVSGRAGWLQTSQSDPRLELLFGFGIGGGVPLRLGLSNPIVVAQLLSSSSFLYIRLQILFNGIRLNFDEIIAYDHVLVGL